MSKLAVDGDGDGLVHDGTSRQRPATPAEKLAGAALRAKRAANKVAAPRRRGAVANANRAKPHFEYDYTVDRYERAINSANTPAEHERVRKLLDNATDLGALDKKDLIRLHQARRDGQPAPAPLPRSNRAKRGVVASLLPDQSWHADTPAKKATRPAAKKAVPRKRLPKKPDALVDAKKPEPKKRFPEQPGVSFNIEHLRPEDTNNPHNDGNYHHYFDIGGNDYKVIGARGDGYIAFDVNGNCRLIPKSEFKGKLKTEWNAWRDEDLAKWKKDHVPLVIKARRFGVLDDSGDYKTYYLNDFDIEKGTIVLRTESGYVLRVSRSLQSVAVVPVKAKTPVLQDDDPRLESPTSVNERMRKGIAEGKIGIFARSDLKGAVLVDKIIERANKAYDDREIIHLRIDIVSKRVAGDINDEEFIKAAKVLAKYEDDLTGLNKKQLGHNSQNDLEASPDLFDKQHAFWESPDADLSHAPSGGLWAYVRGNPDRFDLSWNKESGVSASFWIKDKKTGEKWFSKQSAFVEDIAKEVFTNDILRQVGPAPDTKFGTVGNAADAVVIQRHWCEEFTPGLKPLEDVRQYYDPDYKDKAFVGTFAQEFANAKDRTVGARLLLFDYLIDNMADRHYKNILLVPDPERQSMEVGIIDQGLGFYSGKPDMTFQHWHDRYRGDNVSESGAGTSLIAYAQAKGDMVQVQKDVKFELDKFAAIDTQALVDRLIRDGFDPNRARDFADTFNTRLKNLQKEWGLVAARIWQMGEAFVRDEVKKVT